jgi:hypothetical protein|tara:strand:- start:40 stop:336 length:297 start_codon:yes stop_codon:yes gene_type:complete
MWVLIGVRGLSPSNLPMEVIVMWKKPQPMSDNDNSYNPFVPVEQHTDEELKMLIHQIVNTELQLEFIGEFLSQYLRTDGDLETSFAIAVMEWDLGGTS